jgi:hypothetical protein
MAGALDDEGPAAEGGPDDVAGPLAGIEAAAAVELLDELQAVTSKAAQASTAQGSTGQPATRPGLRAFVVNMISPPLSFP